MDLKLEEKTALVFGGSAGIGASIAQALSQEGAKILIASRDKKRLKQSAEKTGAQGVYPCDLSQKGEAKRVVKEVIREHGALDILLFNTGGPAKSHFMESSEEQWFEDFQSLWMSVIEAFQAVIPTMKDRRFGRLLIVSSIAAKEPLPGLTTSNAFRAGLPGLVKSLIPEVAPFGITANILLPGYTNTDRIQALQLSEEKIRSLVPAGRLGDPAELAALATFLASPQAGYITGQSIAVDGGALKSH